VWECGSVGVWVCGCVGVWVCGCVGVWECGSVGVWECGSVGVWECGCVGVWATNYTLAFEPVGFAAISRWLSAATPPEHPIQTSASRRDASSLPSL
jgi:hypothetical protein